jgi:hypothetical protein
MVRLIGEHWEGDVRVRWYGDDVTNEVTIERWQDPTRASRWLPRSTATARRPSTGSASL